MRDSLKELIAAALGDMAQTFGQTGALLAHRPGDDMLFAQADAALAAIEASGTHVVVPRALLGAAISLADSGRAMRESLNVAIVDCDALRTLNGAITDYEAARSRDAAPTGESDG